MRVEKLRGLLLLSTLCLFLAACETSNLGLDTDESGTVPPEPAGDMTPPRIVFVTPESDTLNVEVDKEIIIEFDELVDIDAFESGDIEFYSGRNVDEERVLLSRRPFDLDFSVKGGTASDPVTGEEIYADASVVRITPSAGRFALDSSYTFKVFIPTVEEFNKSPEEREQDEEENEQTIPDDDEGDSEESIVEDFRSDRFTEFSYYFSVEAGQWDESVPVDLSSSAEALSGDVLDAVAASNAAGEMVVVSRQTVDGVTQAFISKYLPNGNQWTTVGSSVPSVVNATQLSTITNTHVFGTKVAVSSNGHIAVGWYQETAPGQISSVWVRVFDGVQWTPPMRLGAIDQDCNRPDLAFDSVGNLFLVWRQLDGGNYRIFNSIYAFEAQPAAQLSAGWNQAVQLSGTEAGDAYLPSVKPGVQGRVRAFWTHAVNNRSRHLFSRRYIPGEWASVEQMDADIEDAGSVGNYSAVVGARNEGMVVWDQSDGRRSNLWSRRILGSWLGVPERRETDNTGDALYPSMAMDRDGKVILIWRQQISGAQELLESIYKQDSGWSDISVLASVADSTVDQVSISFDREGHATALWKQGQNGSSLVNVRRNLKITGWTDLEKLTEESSGGVLGNPVLAQVHEDGRVLSVWSQFDSDAARYRLMMNRYVEKSLFPPDE